MKVRFYRWYNALLTAMLSMLGYGCSSENGMDMYGTPVVEYGTPNADYVIKGTVTDEAGTPIQDIKAVLKEMPGDNPEYAYGIDSILTDNAGKYQVNANLITGRQWQRLVVQDIDGEANGGAFLSDTIDISKMEAKKVGEGDGRWNEGKFEIQVDVKLKRK